MLFKILYGDKSRISTDITPYHEGYCYVTHDGYFYVDMNNERVKLSAKEAEKLTGYNISTILNSSDLEIPTSKAAKEYIDSAITNVNSIIDATELPTNDINENAIYRTEHTMTIDGTKMYFVDGSGGSPLDIEEFAKSEGASVYINVVNNAQAQSMTASTNTEMHVYIDRETGIAYLNLDNMVLTAGLLFGSLYSMEVSDNGWSTDINSETNPGIYCVYGEINKIYHNYHIFKDSVWTNLTGSGIIDVNTLPKSGANENAIYRVGSVITGADVYLTLIDGVAPVTFETCAAQNGASLTVNTQVVKTLPESIEQSSFDDGGSAYFYILEDTGVAYLDSGSGIQSLGTVFGNRSFDKGWVEDINSVTDVGFFCVRKLLSSCTYHICKGGVWSELPVGGSKIELDTTLSQEGMAADAKAVGDAISSVTTTVNNKVDKVSGKGLSTNDFTDIYKNNIDLLAGKSDARLTYTSNGDGTCSVSGIKTYIDTHVVIPAVANGLSVTGISSQAFSNYANLTSIVIPDSVTSIGDYAFNNCISLTRITIPDSVTSIGDGAFDGCISLKNIVIPSSVTNLGYAILGRCSGLESITLTAESLLVAMGEQVENYPIGYLFGTTSYDEGIATKQYHYTTPSYALSFTTYYIPARLKSVTVTGEKIHDYMFHNCSQITTINISNSVTKLESHAFQGCLNLLEIIIPDSVTSIGSYAFSGCTALTSITIPDSVTSISEYAFRGCSSLESITLPFVGESVKTESDTYQYPFGYIFGSDSYEGGVSTTQYYYGSSTTSETGSVYYIPTSLKSVTITGGNILYGAFYNCSNLTSITILDSVTSIGDYAFYNCSNLTSITIPDGVTNIGTATFYNCSSLTAVYITNLDAWCNFVFGSDSNNPLYYAHNLYLNNELVVDLIIPNGVTKLEYTFCGCNSIKTVVVPDTVTSVWYTFEDCSNIESITLPFVGKSNTEPSKLYYIFGKSGATLANNSLVPDSLKTVVVTNATSIGERVFEDCTSLTSITIPDSVTSIGRGAFYNCSNLTSALIGNSVTSIGSEAFRGCGSLINITIPDSVTSIGGYAFSGCSSLTSITIPHSVTSIGSEAFNGCTGLKNVLIEKGVTNIGSYAFINCSSLTSIAIPDSVTSIGSYAFFGCNNLTSITIPDSVTNINEYEFVGCDILTIYCEAESQPEGWNTNWNNYNRPVVWNFAPDFVSVNEKFSDYITQTELETYINEAILGGAW